MQSTVILLLAATLFHTVQLGTGLDSALAQNEPALLALSGGVPLLAAITLTVFHPGVAFGRQWGELLPSPSSPRYTLAQSRRSHSAANSAANSPAVPYDAAYMPQSAEKSRFSPGSPPGSASPSGRVFKYQQVAPRPLDNLGKKSPGGPITPPYELQRAEGASAQFWPPQGRISGQSIAGGRTPGSKPSSPRRVGGGGTTKEMVDPDAIWR
jgi:hypothetical protein